MATQWSIDLLHAHYPLDNGHNGKIDTKLPGYQGPCRAHGNPTKRAHRVMDVRVSHALEAEPRRNDCGPSPIVPADAWRSPWRTFRPQMGGTTRKRMAANPIEYSSSSSSDGDHDDAVGIDDAANDDELDGVTGELDSTAARPTGHDEEMIEAEFDFYDPQDSDFHGVKALLNSFMDGAYASELANTIVEQTVLGTVVKTNGYPVAVVSVVPLPDALAARLRRKWPSHQNVIDDKRTGLLVYARFVNVPFELVPNMFASVAKDISWAVQNAGRQYDFDVLLCPARHAPPQPKKKSKAARSDPDFLFAELDAVSNVAVQRLPMSPTLTMLVFHRARLPSIVQRLHAAFDAR